MIHVFDEHLIDFLICLMLPQYTNDIPFPLQSNVLKQNGELTEFISKVQLEREQIPSYQPLKQVAETQLLCSITVSRCIRLTSIASEERSWSPMPFREVFSLGAQQRNAQLEKWFSEGLEQVCAEIKTLYTFYIGHLMDVRDGSVLRDGFLRCQVLMRNSTAKWKLSVENFYVKNVGLRWRAEREWCCCYLYLCCRVFFFPIMYLCEWDHVYIQKNNVCN